MSDDDSERVDNERAATRPDATVDAPDPTRDLPSPGVEVPDPTAGPPDDEVPDPTAGPPDDEDADEPAATVEVPRDLWFSFWYLVVVFNAAVLALGVGLLLVTLGNDLELGTRLLAVGGVLSAYGYYRYRTNPYSDGVDADTDSGAT